MRTRRESIDLIRMFNRRYVPVMRLLDRSYLGTGSSTLEIAVLIEIGEREAVSARDISLLLSVDKGYLSRTIRRFEEQGLVARTASGVDARVQLLSLTDSGRDRVAELSDSGADVVAEAFRDADDDALARVADAMNVILGILEGKERPHENR